MTLLNESHNIGLDEITMAGLDRIYRHGHRWLLRSSYSEGMDKHLSRLAKVLEWLESEGHIGVPDLTMAMMKEKLPDNEIVFDRALAIVNDISPYLNPADHWVDPDVPSDW